MPEDKSAETIIWHNVFDPNNALFKQPGNARCERHQISCKLAECPLRDAGRCIARKMLDSACPYGRRSTKTGPTRRAKSFYSWLSEERAAKPETALDLESPPDKMAFIGEYVYLPYAHMDMCEAAPFLSHSGFFMGGNPFIRREDWSIDVVLLLINFRPCALMGGQIRSYTEKSIPKFVNHLYEVDCEMWERLIKEHPEFDKEPDYVGRTALLRTLNFPIKWSTRHDKYPVEWTWDGEWLQSTSRNLYSSTWGRIDVDEVEIKARPAEHATLVVQDRAWVNDETEFVD